MAHLRSLRAALALMILAIIPLVFSEVQSAGQSVNDSAETRLWTEEQESGDSGSEQVPGQPSEGSDEPDISTVEEAFEYTAASYAEYFGVSMEAARRALILQDDAGKLEATLMEHERAYIAGFRIEHLPEFHIVISVVEGGEAGIRSFVEETPLRDVTQFELVSLTLDELLKDQAVAGRMAEQVGVEHYSAPVGQRIELYTPDAEELERLLRDAGLTLPETVDIIEAPPPVQEANYLGGFAISVGGEGCTSGYTGYRVATGEGGVFTAAHCGSPNNNNMVFQHASGTLQFHTEFHSGPRDLQFNFNTTTNDLRSMVNVGFTWYPVTGETYWSQQSVGGFVCKYGRTTHYDCGTISSKQVNISGSATWIAVQKNGQTLTSFGDSGAPWFSVQGFPSQVKAYGIHSGSIDYNGGTASVYQAINYTAPTWMIYVNCQPDWYC